jgi:heptosyltransferase-1
VAHLARGPVSGFDRNSAREPVASLFYRHRYAVPRSRHAIERNRRLAAAALGYEFSGPPHFGLVAQDAPDPGMAQALGAAPYAVLFTNASRPTKRWPDERWAALGGALQTRGLRVLCFAGSPAERADTQRRMASIPGALLAPPCALDTVAGLLARARVAVGLDTGLTHLSAALGVPSVGIYCDYDPQLVGLAGAGPVCSLGGVGQHPSVASVVDAVDRVLVHAANAPAGGARVHDGTPSLARA